MAILSKATIIERLENGDLTIEPFVKDNIQPASYDCTLGTVLKAGEGRVNLATGDDFTLESNTWASIATREVLKLPNDVCARYGIPSSLARRGLISFGGPQIDPGYRGKMFVSVYNPTLESINLRFGQDFLTVIFEAVGGDKHDGYSGRYQDQTDFPVDDVEMMMRMRSKNLSDVIDRVETLDGSVSNLATNMNTLTSTVTGISQDVHVLKETASKYTPWVKVFFWLFAIAAAAVVADTAVSWFGAAKNWLSANGAG